MAVDLAAVLPLLDQFAKQYPQYVPLLQIPEVGAQLLLGATQGWSADKLQGALYNTQWWKQTPQAERQFLILKVTDPATAQQQLDTMNRKGQQLARDLGIPLTQENMKQFADLLPEAITNGWDDATFSQELAKSLGAPRAEKGGSIGQGANDIAGLASDYGLPMSDGRAQDLAYRVATGKGTMDTVKTYLENQAKALYPQFTDAMDRGATLRQAVDPYIQTAAQMLNIDPESIKLSDAKWAPIYSTKDAQGKPTTLSLDQWQRRLMSDSQYGWGKTDQAKQAAYNLVYGQGGLAETFGFR